MHRLRLKAAKILQDNFINTLLQDINNNLKHPPPDTTVTSPRPSLDYHRFSDTLRDQIKQYLDLLHLVGFVDKATQSYREAVVREAKLIVKNHLPPEDSDSNDSTVASRTTADKSIALAQSLRNMPPSSYNTMLATIYTLTCEFVRRIAAHEKLLLDLTSTDIDPALAALATPNGTETARVPVSLNDIVGSTVDTAQGRITKILAVRADQNEKFGIPEFTRLYTISASFIAECESFSGRPGTLLQVEVTSQDRLNILAKVIDTDQWALQETPLHHQEIVQFLVHAATSDHSTEILKPTSDSKIQHILVDEQRYFVSSSLLNLLFVLQEYQQLSQTLTPHVAEIASNMIEILKLFNSRICQMILGAGATKAAGLKSITAKHLALASQSLGAVVALVPYTREFFRRYLNNTSALSEFDRVKRTLQEHQEEIHAKLVSIMGDRLQAHCKTMMSKEWASSASIGKNNAYAQILVKETSTLHRVLSRYLSEDTRVSIMSRVFQLYTSKLVEAFSQVPISCAEEKSILVEDAKFITTSLSSLEKVPGFENTLIETMENRNIYLNEGVVKQGNATGV
ncbi:Vacuolar protein sorting-associated protein 54, chloroplastic [Neolecta irregularis DAH-3]|uniref:Vacuolar protein sorting-associated protein 54, chloroplastic n=1 Tax=Neolecta irregularis (strain DAH-3) TaxID=1198029 RepID=A0A1U7LHH3_NEOID|nr:Vacuolar protein sorting-associated protein 54, chloroplastic [Neolecta irregularis DAH-3]|eukprot:OLL22094.1 Vacuolar protein sorting-associated protein 54, chloroplastic [Neolecta irregularis DAH-3]